MLAQHGGVEAGGDLEAMGGRLLVEVGHEVVGQHGEAGVGVVGEHVAGHPEGVVEPVGVEVELEAVARGEHHGPPHDVTVAQVAHHLGQAVRWQADLLEHGERGAAVVQSEGDDGHR